MAARLSKPFDNLCGFQSCSGFFPGKLDWLFHLIYLFINDFPKIDEFGEIPVSSLGGF